MKQKTLSIIIATFNAEKTLKRCLDSIVSNDMNQIELIIIDGGSKDKTIDIIKFYEKNIFFWMSEPDKGIYDAWNKGIEHITAKWVEFIGSDDFILPNALNEYMAFINSVDTTNVDIITARIRIANEKGKVLKSVGKPFTWHKCRKYMVAPHPSILHSKKLFDEVGYYDIAYKSAGDTELLYRKGPIIQSLYFEKEIVQFQIGGTSFSLRGLKESMKCRRQHHTVPAMLNYIIFIKGCLSLFVKQLLWR